MNIILLSILIIIILWVYYLVRINEPFQSTFGYNTFKIYKDSKFYNPDIYTWYPFRYGYWGPEKYHHLIKDFKPFSFYGKPNNFYKKFHGYVPRTVQRKHISDPDVNTNLLTRCEKYAKYICRNKNEHDYYHCFNHNVEDCLNKYD